MAAVARTEFKGRGPTRSIIQKDKQNTSRLSNKACRLSQRKRKKEKRDMERELLAAGSCREREREKEKKRKSRK